MSARRLLTFTAATLTAAAIVGFGLLAGHTQPEEVAADVAPATDPTPEEGSWAATAAALPLITDADAEDAPPYRRADYGERWLDVDGNGCGQRDDVLARDLTDIVRSACAVTSGTLHDPYTGETIAFPRERAALGGSPIGRSIRLDRIVSLRSAHAGGAWKWSPEHRAEFANSLENMLAVDGEAARTRNGEGPAAWLPQDDFVCNFAIRYTWIANAWGLAVTSDDRDALSATLIACKR